MQKNTYSTISSNFGQQTRRTTNTWELWVQAFLMGFGFYFCCFRFFWTSFIIYRFELKETTSLMEFKGTSGNTKGLLFQREFLLGPLHSD